MVSEARVPVAEVSLHLPAGLRSAIAVLTP